VLSLLKTTFGLVVALFVCFQLTYSQQTDSPKTETPHAELREKAFTVLESLADQFSTLQSAENRARMGANLGESLWTRDEKRARALFQLVQDDIKLGLQTRKRSLFPNTDTTSPVFLKLREDTVRRIAKLDPELALLFLSDTFTVVKETQSFPDGTLRRETVLREKALEAEVGKLLARTHPETALKLARKTLAGEGLEEGLRTLLLQLASKHKEEARMLHREIVNKIADTDLKNDEDALNFSTRLAQSFIPPAADMATFKELLNILLTTALESGCANQNLFLCYAIAPVVPLMTRYLPTGAARLKRWSGASDYPNEPDSAAEVRYQLSELRDSGSVDEMLALAAKYPEMENTIVMQAFRTAESNGDYERAKQIATDYRGAPENRQSMNDRVAQYGLDTALSAAQFERLQQDLGDLPPRGQIEMLLSFANHAALYDRTTAIKALNQARNLIDNLELGGVQTGAQMTLAALYCLAKSDQGFAIMEAMVPKLNELIAAGAKLDGFNTHYLRDGEWNMTAEGELGRLLTFLSNRAAVFAWYDFERAINLAGQFERPEIRMMAQLKLAQGILQNAPKRLSRGLEP
jgi:hypothetical protein